MKKIAYCSTIVCVAEDVIFWSFSGSKFDKKSKDLIIVTAELTHIEVADDDALIAVYCFVIIIIIIYYQIHVHHLLYWIRCVSAYILNHLIRTH